MRMYFVTAVMVVGLADLAIAQQPINRLGNPPAVRDPVQDFERLVKRCQTAVEAVNTPVISVYYSSDTQSWVRGVKAFEVRYDVRKTESLVAPIVGQINVVEIIATGTAADEQSAAALDFSIASSPTHVRTRYEAIFIWREKKWVFKEGTSIIDFRQKDGTYGNTLTSAIDASKGVAYYGPVAACFPS